MSNKYYEIKTNKKNVSFGENIFENIEFFRQAFKRKGVQISTGRLNGLERYYKYYSKRKNKPLKWNKNVCQNFCPPCKRKKQPIPIIMDEEEEDEEEENQEEEKNEDI